MKKITETIIKTIGILVGGTLMGAALLAVAFALQVSESNQTESLAIIQEEGWYPAIPVVSASLNEHFHSYLPGVLDGGTDTIMLKTALQPRETNVVKASMDMNGYDYYWHGYVSVLRPLLAVFDYGEIRVLNGMLQLLLVVLLFLQIYRKKGLVYGLLVLTSYCLLMSLAMPFSLQYSWVFYIAMTGALFLSSKDRAARMDGMKLYWLFMGIGMATSFFDLLTYPLYTWGIPLVWLILLREDGAGPFVYVKEVVLTGLWWILGYGGLWVMKWGLGSALLGRNIFESALYEVGFRLGAEDTGAFGWTDRLEVLYSNWKHYEYKIYVLLLGCWLGYVVVQSIRRGVDANGKSKALALIGCSSIVWYLALANHTGGHHFFTYRIYGVAVLALLAILVGALGVKKESQMRNRWLVPAVWCICAVLACPMALMAREDIDVTNGDRAYQKLELVPGEVGKMQFIPAFPTVTEIGICAETSAMEGECVVQIKAGDDILYQESIALEKYAGVTYATIPVHWKLERGKAYEMAICFEGADGATALLISQNMENPIGEYGETSVNGVSQGGQLLSGITYSFRPLSKFTLAFLAMTWCGILFAGYAVCLRKKA